MFYKFILFCRKINLNLLLFFYYDFNKVLYNSIYNTLSIDYNMFLYKNKNGSGYMEKKVNLEQKIIDLKLKKRELVLAGKNTSDVDEEIKKTQEACFKACGTEPTLIRPPYGAKNDTVKSAFYSYGLSMILWDGDTEDWRYSKVTNGAQIVCDNIIRDAKSKTGDGNIVLIHDIHENSVAGLEMALDQLSKEGYQFVTVSDLLKYKGHSEYK